jgi:hypothetical protein
LSSVGGQHFIDVQAQRLFQQQPDGSGAVHAVATPGVEAVQQFWA